MVNRWVPHNQDSLVVQTVFEEVLFRGDQLQEETDKLSPGHGHVNVRFVPHHKDHLRPPSPTRLLRFHAALNFSEKKAKMPNYVVLKGHSVIINQP